MKKMSVNILTVGQINTYLSYVISFDKNLQKLYVVGEISNFKEYYKNGNCYFDLKDDIGIISCVMFKNYADKLNFNVEDGLKVVVYGRISLYEKQGKYQLYCISMTPDGIGTEYLALEQLKLKLEKEGLFSQENKKELPEYPSRIGVITSASGAVWHDIKTTIERRWPFVELMLYPSKVQGINAAKDLISGIKYFDEQNKTDVIIIGRGGGSREDLYVFNDEQLARAIFKSKTPIISAVGHETDFSICDFTADKRAATPTAAAELSVPNLADKFDCLLEYENKFKNQLEIKLNSKKYTLFSLIKGSVFERPEALFERGKHNLAYIKNKIYNNFNTIYLEKFNQYTAVSERLNALNPVNVMLRGYVRVSKADDIPLNSVKELKKDDVIKIEFTDGKANAIITEINNEK